MYCKKCGSPLSNDSAFCDSCGTRVKENGRWNENAVRKKPDEKALPDNDKIFWSPEGDALFFFLVLFSPFIALMISLAVTGYPEDTETATSQQFSEGATKSNEQDGNDENTKESTHKEIHSGTIEITDGVNTATVRIPEGFDKLSWYSAEDEEPSEVLASDGELPYTVTANIWFYPNDDSDEYLEWEVGMDSGRENISEFKESDVKTKAIDNYNVSYKTTEYLNHSEKNDFYEWFFNYYCCTEVNGELLVVQINYSNYGSEIPEAPEADDSLIEDVFNAVTVH